MSEEAAYKEINEHLRSYGYNLIYSYNDDYCSNALLEHLGKGAYLKYGKKVIQYAEKNGVENVENYVRSLIGKDTKHLKILISGQIAISVAILQQVIDNLNNALGNRTELSILELGGYDGWASDYLNKKLNISSKIDVVDRESKVQSKNENVRLIEDDYNSYRSESKYDVVFSILGAPAGDLSDLISCITSNIKDNGIAYLGLRIQPEDYVTFVEHFSSHKLFQLTETVSTVSVNMSHGWETLPVFSLQYRK
jgi:hypothetical protein